LVLAGGQSLRMGVDKGNINWHGKPQRYHMADMLSHFVRRCLYRTGPASRLRLNGPYPVLQDTFTGLGPYGAILSAFRENPDAAWLVIACDLPLMDEDTLRNLVAWRNSSSVATAYHSPVTEFPEPLIAIWEPKSYPILLSYLAQGYSCPRKVLINTDITLLNAPEPEALTNVNTPEEMESKKDNSPKISRQPMIDNDLRYSCQIALPGFSEAAQQLLQQAKVLIVGAGG
jgi:molybdopterin-guanine dinucleotide biosynthesis protein A